MARGSSWSEQYERMNRWKHRLWLDPMLHKEDAIDTLYAFAVSCYHLGDWLWNDGSQSLGRDEVRAYIDASSALKLCGDICNGSKHAQLKPKGVHVTTKSSVESVQIQDMEIKVNQAQLSVDWDGRTVDVETFAKVCVGEWDRFLREKGLLDAEVRIMCLIDGQAYSVLREATILSPETLAAIGNAARMFGGTAWELRCSPTVAREICEWLNRVEQWYLAQPNAESGVRICRAAAEAISAELAGQAAGPN